jgi:cystathionine beta-synthase
MAEAIARMAEQDISQIPVIEEKRVVGSLTETSILSRLIEEPSARERPIRDVMSDPFPVIPRTLHINHLSEYLEQDLGAVLVHTNEEEGYEILTKSDLISALVNLGRAN